MNTETKTIPISGELFKTLEEITKGKDAAKLVEKVMTDYAKRLRKRQSEREIEILNRIAEEQHDEIMETLEYQIDW